MGEMEDRLRALADSRRDKEAKEYLDKNMKPLKGVCDVCLMEDGEHKDWCYGKDAGTVDI